MISPTGPVRGENRTSGNHPLTSLMLFLGIGLPYSGHSNTVFMKILVDFIMVIGIHMMYDV